MKFYSKMENSEEVYHHLEEFTKRKPKIIPQELNDYLCYVARTGDSVYQWPLLKSLFKEKLLNVITEFYETTPGMDIPTYPNVDPFNYETMKNSLLERFDTFTSAPFTVQRICELLTCPRKQYNRIDKFMRAIEKNILVVTTIEPGSQRHIDHENNDHNDKIVNGSDNNSECHVDVEMEDVTCKENNDQILNEPPSTTVSNVPMEDQPSVEEPQKTELICPETSTSCYESLTPPSSDEEQVDNLKVEENTNNNSQEPEQIVEIPSTVELSEMSINISVDTSHTIVIPKIVEDVEIMENKSANTPLVETEDQIVTDPLTENSHFEEIKLETSNILEGESKTKNKETEIKTSSENSVSSEESTSSDNADFNSNSPKQEFQQVNDQEESDNTDLKPELESNTVPEVKETPMPQITENIEKDAVDIGIQSDSYSVTDINSEISEESHKKSEDIDSVDTGLSIETKTVIETATVNEIETKDNLVEVSKEDIV